MFVKCRYKDSIIYIYVGDGYEEKEIIFQFDLSKIKIIEKEKLIQII